MAAIARGVIEVAEFHHAAIAAEDVGKFIGDVVVVAQGFISVTVAFVQVGRRLAVVTIGAVDAETVEGVADQGRVFAGFIVERGMNASGIDMIVISSSLVGVAATFVENFIFGRIFAFAGVGIVEGDAVDGHADRSHRQSCDMVGHAGVARNPECVVLAFDGIGIVRVGKRAGGVIGNPVAVDDNEVVGHIHLDVGAKAKGRLGRRQSSRQADSGGGKNDRAAGEEESSSGD